MAFIEIKTINGRQYKYLIKSYRVGNKVKHKMIKYLGPVKSRYKKSRGEKNGFSKKK